MAKHKDLKPSTGIHSIHAFEFTNTTEMRNEARIEGDVGKVAKVGDDFFILASLEPLKWTFMFSALGGDLTFNHPFANAIEVQVVHNLGKFPAVTCFDVFGEEFGAYIKHHNLNSLEVRMSPAMSGWIQCK